MHYSAALQGFEGLGVRGCEGAYRDTYKDTYRDTYRAASEPPIKDVAASKLIENSYQGFKAYRKEVVDRVFIYAIIQPCQAITQGTIGEI